MIGQKDLKNVFDVFIKGEKPLSRSILLIGSVGSGRKTFSHWLMQELRLPLIEIGSKADDIRELSDMCYKLVEPTYYLIADVEQMSGVAQNALLKILEEPPNNAGFILTAVQEGLILSTIKSRCVTYYMNSYSDAEIDLYADSKYTLTEANRLILHKLCVCPGDVDLLLQHDITQFMDYVKKVFKNIAVVSGSNSFKIADKINLADDNTKFDLVLFWRAFISECMSGIMEDRKYASAITITTEYMQDLRIKGVNKQMLFDNWILDIRKEWL